MSTDFIVDQLLNAWEFMSEKEMYDHLIQDGSLNSDKKKKLKALIKKWYNDTSFRSKYELPTSGHSLNDTVEKLFEFEYDEKYSDEDIDGELSESLNENYEVDQLTKVLQDAEKDSRYLPKLKVESKGSYTTWLNITVNQLKAIIKIFKSQKTGHMFLNTKENIDENVSKKILTENFNRDSDDWVDDVANHTPNSEGFISLWNISKEAPTKENYIKFKKILDKTPRFELLKSFVKDIDSGKYNNEFNNQTSLISKFFKLFKQAFETKDSVNESFIRNKVKKMLLNEIDMGKVSSSYSSGNYLRQKYHIKKEKSDKELNQMYHESSKEFEATVAKFQAELNKELEKHMYAICKRSDFGYLTYMSSIPHPEKKYIVELFTVYIHTPTGSGYGEKGKFETSDKGNYLQYEIEIPTGKKRIKLGDKTTPKDIVNRILKDRPFFEKNGMGWIFKNKLKEGLKEAKTISRKSLSFENGNVYINGDLYGTEQEFYDDVDSKKIILKEDSSSLGTVWVAPNEGSTINELLKAIGKNEKPSIGNKKTRLFLKKNRKLQPYDYERIDAALKDFKL